MFVSLLKTGLVSWQTTLMGLFAALLAIAKPQISAWADDDPTTKPDWLVVLGAAFMILFGIKARDGDKSTEQHKPK